MFTKNSIYSNTRTVRYLKSQLLLPLFTSAWFVVRIVLTSVIWILSNTDSLHVLLYRWPKWLVRAPNNYRDKKELSRHSRILFSRYIQYSICSHTLLRFLLPQMLISLEKIIRKYFFLSTYLQVVQNLILIFKNIIDLNQKIIIF